MMVGSGSGRGDAAVDGVEAFFNLGISVSPYFRAQSDVEDLQEIAKASSRVAVSSFVVGAKSGGEPGVRSNVAICTGLLPQLKGVDRVGCLFLARQQPFDTLLASARTLAEFVRWAGCIPVVGLMRGRQAGSPAASRSLSSVIASVRDDPVLAGCELWVPAERGQALVRAARLADVWLANAYYDAEGLRAQLRVFAGSAARRVVRRDFVCDPDGDRARKMRTELLRGGYRGGRFNESSLIAGSPAECIERLAEVAALGFGEILVRPAIEGRGAVEQCHLLLDEWEATMSLRP